MSSIIIDGYNLIGVVHRDLEAQRQRLIEALSDYKKHKAHDITVVFDGWKNGTVGGDRQIIKGISVIYSPLGEKADAVIKGMITKGGRQHIVISSDREIQAHAWSHNSIPLNAEDFLSVLEGGAESEDSFLSPGRKKGMSNTPSKKDKAIKRALNKL